MNHPESIIQAAIVSKLSNLGIFLFSIPNDAAGRISPARAARLVASGLRAGVSDLILIGADGRAHFLEIKTPAGRLSPRQKIFAEHCQKMGWPYEVARSVDEALTICKKWGMI